VGDDGSGPIVATSPDGVSWTPHPLSVPQVKAVAWNGSRWLAAGDQAAATSADGATWTGAGVPGTRVQDVAWTGTEWVVVGIGIAGPQVQTSPNLVAWTPAPVSFATFGLGVAYKRPTYPPLP
jgi:hypothetical protein